MEFLNSKYLSYHFLQTEQVWILAALRGFRFGEHLGWTQTEPFHLLSLCK